MPTDPTFERQKYLVMRNVLAASEVAFFHAHALSRGAKDDAARDDHQVPGTPSFYGDPLMESLLEKLRPRIEQVTGLELYPTYSYFRIYKRGDTLARHTDRPACEVSFSLSLGHNAPTPWPLWVEGPMCKTAAELEPGDALLYRGTECPHWREPFTGEGAAQVFLHYVERNGKYAEWKFDKRPALGTIGFPNSG